MKSTLAAVMVAWVCVTTTLVGCGGPPPSAPQSSAQRLNAEGMRRLGRGELDGAAQMFQAALREAELVDDLTAQAETWNNLGALAMAAEDLGAARRCFEAALRLHETGTPTLGLVRARLNLAAATMAGGGSAALQYERALADAEQVKDAELVRTAKLGLAAARLRAGAVDAAASLAHEVLATAGADEIAQAGAHTVLGAAAEARGDLAVARREHEAALALERKREEPQAVREQLRALARVAARAGDLGRAATLLARSARISRWLGQLETAGRELDRAEALAQRAGGAVPQLTEERRALDSARQRLVDSQRGLPPEDP